MTKAAWSQLSTDIWAVVFGLVQNQLRLDEMCMWCMPDEEQQDLQAEFFSLRLVCKKFEEVFAHHPGLQRSVFISRAFQGPALANLVQWLTRHNAVENLVVADRSCLEVLLTALQLTHCPVKRANIYTPETSSCISLLSALSLLHSCQLTATRETTVDLSSLQALPHLESLGLHQGTFDKLNALPYLTALTLTHSTAGCWQNARCATSLLKLRLEDSRVCGLTDGLSACCNLTSFICEDGLITAAENHVHFDRESSPQGVLQLTALSSLTHLSVAFGQDIVAQEQPEPLQVNWLYQLTLLQSLSIKFYGRRLCLSKDLCSLSQLTCLQLNADSSREYGDVEIQLCFPWTAFVFMNKVCLGGAHFVFGVNLSELATLDRLQQISIHTTTGPHAPILGQVCGLAYVLAVKKPQVGLYLNHAPVRPR